MNLPLYGRVFWRFRVLVLLGLLLATVLGLLVTAKPVLREGRPSLVYRQAEVWGNVATLIVTQTGAPEFRSVFPAAPVPEPGGTPRTYPFADPNRFAGLTAVYAQLATSDDVDALIRRSGPIRGKVKAAPITSTVGSVTPLIALAGEADSPREATSLTRRATSAFIRYVDERQRAAGIPPRQRVVIQIVRRIDKPQLIEPRSMTLPIMVFLAVLTATMALAFLLENVRRRAPAVHPLSEDRQAVSARRSA